MTSRDKVNSSIPCEPLDHCHLVGLLEFLEALRSNGEGASFHPHSFDKMAIQTILQSRKLDEYYVMRIDSDVVAYGMLRGWDAGFLTPTLGIATHPDHRRQGLASAMMKCLHSAAKLKGAKSIRLKVYSDNNRAIKLYKALGYMFIGHEGDQLIAVFDL